MTMTIVMVTTLITLGLLALCSLLCVFFSFIAAGMPDENRAGRAILKDFQSGKLLHIYLPPGGSGDVLSLPPSLCFERGESVIQPRSESTESSRF